MGYQTRRRIGSHTVDVTANGFLTDSGQWTPALAREIARDRGVGELTERHWTVLGCCREEAAKHGGSTPDLDRIVALTGLSPAILHELFPGDPRTLVALVAGLPKPTQHHSTEGTP